MFDIRRHLVRAIVITIVLLAIFAFVVNVLYQLQQGSLSGISYKYYLIASFNAVLVVIGAYVLYQLLYYMLIRSLGSRLDEGSADTVRLILRVLFFVVAITIVLITFGVNLQTSLAGGAIGGIVLGLAVQSIATSILSGLFVASSRIVKPGDVVTLKSSAWGEFTATVVNVSVLWTYVVNQFGNSMFIPNSALFGNILFTKLKYNGELRYLLKVLVTSDAPTSPIKKKAEVKIAKEFGKYDIPMPNIYLLSKDGSTNTFAVTMRFNKFAELNPLVDIVNTAFNDAYWEVKKESKP